MWSGAARSTPITDKTDRKKPSAWRKGTRKTRRSVNAVSIAQSENVFGAPGRPDGDGRHASVASAERHSVTSPRWTNAPRDPSSCTSDGPLIACRDRAPAAVTVAREPTAASSQPKGCAPTPVGFSTSEYGRDYRVGYGLGVRRETRVGRAEGPWRVLPPSTLRVVPRHVIRRIPEVRRARGSSARWRHLAGGASWLRAARPSRRSRRSCRRLLVEILRR